jgi:hypothetical protein
MFTLTEDLLPKRLAWAEFALCLAGLTGLTLAFYMPALPWIGWLGGLAYLVGVILFAGILARLYRRRRRRVFDINTPFTQTGTLLFVATLVVLLWLARRAAIAHLPDRRGQGPAARLVGQIVIGQMYKMRPSGCTAMLRWSGGEGARPGHLCNRRLALAGYGGGISGFSPAPSPSWRLQQVDGCGRTPGCDQVWLFLINMAFVATR